MSLKLHLYSDGGARGNPGPSAVAFVATNEVGVTQKTGSRYIGNHTNNQAEYYALHMALEYAKDVGAQEVICHLDSELVAKQLTGEYRIKNVELQRLNDQVKTLLRSFRKVTFVNLPREHNRISIADALVNKTLDEEASKRVQPKINNFYDSKNGQTGLFLHASIRTSNMQRSIDFYQKYFGLQVKRQMTIQESNSEIAFLQDPDSKGCILELAHYHNQTEFVQPRFADRLFDHLGFDVPDITNTITAMKSGGVTVANEPYRFNSYTIIAFVEDPDGTLIELVERK
jgi:lactoylglutathione lyase